MFEVLEQLSPGQKIILLQGMNAGFIGIIISADNEQKMVRRYLLEFMPQFHRKRQ
jgi:hypothetical protein